MRDETRAIGVDSAGVEHANFCGDLELFIRLASREFTIALSTFTDLGGTSIVVSADMIVLFILSNYTVNYPSSSNRLKSFVVYIAVLSAMLYSPILWIDVDPEVLIKAYKNKPRNSQEVSSYSAQH